MRSVLCTLLGVALASLALWSLFWAVVHLTRPRPDPRNARSDDWMAGFATVLVRRSLPIQPGAGKALRIVVDGAPRGKLRPSGKVLVHLPRGHHTVRVTAGRASSPERGVSLEVGESAAFEATVIPGPFGPRVELRQVS